MARGGEFWSLVLVRVGSVPRSKTEHLNPPPGVIEVPVEQAPHGVTAHWII